MCAIDVIMKHLMFNGLKIKVMAQIDDTLYEKLRMLGIISSENDDVRAYNVGKSNYSQRTIQPWSIWIDWNLDPWDADIVKRVLRDKEGEPREMDYDKIIHDCKEKKRQIAEQKRQTKGE